MSPPLAPTPASAPPPPYTIVHDDGVLLIVDKPFGLPSQAEATGGAAHLYGLLCARFGYVGLHHRLDTPASGLLAFTRHRRANAPLAAAFRAGAVDRQYLAVVVGDPGPSGRWDAPLDGQNAATRFVRWGTRDGLSALLVTLETGRTHQIRRHAADAGHPLAGDRRHGGAAGRLWPRLALHAATLALPHPRTGAPLRFTAPLPADLAALFAPFGPPPRPSDAG